MGGGFGSGTKEEKDHRHHLLAADASALLFNADEVRDQAFAPGVAGNLQASLQVSFHWPDAGDHAQQAERAGQAGQAVRPGDEAGPVGTRQAEQLADDRKRQFAGIALDQVCRVALGKKLGRSKAHDLLYDIARKVAQSGEHLLDALEADPEIRKHADRKKLKAMVDPANYLGVAGPMVDRVLKGRKKKY